LSLDSSEDLNRKGKVKRFTSTISRENLKEKETGNRGGTDLKPDSGAGSGKEGYAGEK